MNYLKKAVLLCQGLMNPSVLAVNTQFRTPLKIDQCVRALLKRGEAQRALSHRCYFFSHQLYFVCVVHPDGVSTDHCLDFRPDPNVKDEELWAPIGYSWYGDDLIENRPSRYTSEEQLEILDSHPFFTGTCPQCSHKLFETSPPPHAPWHCPQCDWLDDSML